MKRTMQYLYVATAVVFVLGLGAWSAQGLDDYRQPRALDIANGELAQAIEAHYNAHFPVKNLGINVWAALRYGLLREGEPGVVVGDNGWLFTNEEFKFYPDVQERLQTRFRQIDHVARYLERHGARLALVLVPAKARIYAGQVGERQPAPFYRTLYDEALAQIRAARIPAPDLRPPLQSPSDEAAFLKTDTHWTPHGARRAAEAVAQQLRAAQLTSGNGATAFTTELVERKHHRGDLLNFIPLGPFADWLGPPPDQLAVYNTYATAENSGGLFGEVEIDTVLVGSSYSADPAWNFAGALKQALGRDLLNYAEEGQGPLLPMLSYLASPDFRDQPPKLVIWEFPERYLPVTYDTRRYADLFEGDDSFNGDEQRQLAGAPPKS